MRWSLLGGLGLAVLFFLVRTSRILPDGIQYCLDARDGTNLLHPHHLIFIPAIRFTKFVLELFGAPADWIFAAQFHNVLFVVPLLGALYFWLRESTGDRWTASLATVTVACLNSVMLFATQPESYLPALACGMVSIAAANASQSSARRTVTAASFLALAVLYHQLAVLLALPVFVAAMGERLGAIRRATGILVGAGAVTVAAYVVAWMIDESPSPEGFFGYLTRYAHTSNATWGTFENVSLDGGDKLGKSLLAAIVGARWTGVPGLFVLGFVFALVVFQCLRSARASANSTVRNVGGTWIALLGPFLLWWLPGQEKYAIFWILPVVVLLALASRELFARRWSRIAVIAMIVGVLGIGNFLSRVWPDHVTEHAPRVRAAELAEQSQPGTVVIADTETSAFLRYDYPEIISIPVAVPMFCAFNDTLDAYLAQVSDPLARASKILVPFDVINPTQVVDGMCGNVYPPGWRRFLDWLLGVHTKSPGQFRMRQVESVSLRSGEVILRIGPDFDTVPGRRGVFDRLDAALAKLAGPKFSFIRWYDSFGSD